MAYNVLSGTVGSSTDTVISGTFIGDGADLTNTPGPNTVVVDTAADNRLITFTSTNATTIRGEPNLTFDGTLLSITGRLSASAGLSGSVMKVLGIVSGGLFQGDGSGLTGVSTGGSSAGIFTEINGSTAYTTSSVSIGGTSAPDHRVAISGSLSASVHMSASSFYGEYFNIKNTVDDGTTNRTMLRLHNYRADDADVNDFGPISIDFEIEQLTGGSKTGLARITGVQCPIGTDHTTVLGEKTSGLIFSTMNNNTLAEAMRINASGNLGIGTTDPTYALDVAGDAGFDEYIYRNGDTDTYIRFQGDQINIVAGAAQMIYINEGGAGDQADKVTINNDGADVDFQVKGTDWANLLRTDAVEGRVGIGMVTGVSASHTLMVAGASHLSGGLVHRRRAVAAHYTASAGDYFLGVDTSAGQISISLNATQFADGQTLVIKDETGDASTNVITLTAAIAQKIDVDSRSVVIESPFGAVNLYTDSGNWFIY